MRGPILTMQKIKKKRETIYTVYCTSSVFSPNLKIENRNISSESGIKTKFNPLKKRHTEYCKYQAYPGFQLLLILSSSSKSPRS